ncbi:Uncharacterized HTH-type transcriptional regulator yegW [Morganella morganii]|nr:Uncharacterized HTH-type transcriptional regulator yegW [Morganella morganii]
MEHDFLTFLQHRLDQQSTVPLYLQLKQGIEEAITQKQLTHGCVLPSERRLSQSLGVSRVTVVKALDLLLKQGLVVKHHGKGTQINLPVQYNLSGGGFSAQAAGSGKVSNRWLIRQLDSVPDSLAPRNWKLSAGDTMAVIKRVRLVDDIPVSLETMFIPEAFLPRPDLLDGSLYAHWLAQGIEPGCAGICSLYLSPDRGRRQNCLSIPPTASLMKIILRSPRQAGQGAGVRYGYLPQ